jgi:hypothetical protein
LPLFMKNPWILLPEGTRGWRFQPTSIFRSRDAGSVPARGFFCWGIRKLCEIVLTNNGWEK